MTNEEQNAGDGVTNPNDESDKDESTREKRKARAKSVTLKEETQTHGKLCTMFLLNPCVFTSLSFISDDPIRYLNTGNKSFTLLYQKPSLYQIKKKK